MNLRLKTVYLLSLLASILSLPAYAFFKLMGDTWWSKVIMLTYDWFSKYYDRYVKFLPGYEEASKYALQSVDIHSNAVVLDVACGTGFLTLKIAGKAREVVGIDLSRGQLLQLKHKIDVCSGSVHLVRGDAEMLPFRDNAFNIVFSQGALSEIADPQRALGEMIRVLRRKGTLVTITYGKKRLISIINPWTFKPETLETIVLRKKLYVKRIAWLKPYYLLLIGVKHS